MDKKANMVDERYEFISLIYKLAGHRAEYNDSNTQYQQELLKTFDVNKNHPAVTAAKNSQCSYDRIFLFALHIEKEADKFVLTDNIDSLFNSERWLMKESETSELLDLFNEFYITVKFNHFFCSHLHFYENLTKKFTVDWYSHIDFNWFEKYIDTSTLRCIISPSDSRHNYAAEFNGLIYCLVRENGGQVNTIHEYCHSFANPIAEKWYNENQNFKKLCDDSVNPEKLPSYQSGLYMAYEYVTRAYTILHFCQSQSNGSFYNVRRIGYKWNEAAPMLMVSDYKNGFVHILEIYDMVLRFENEKDIKKIDTSNP